MNEAGLDLIWKVLRAEHEQTHQQIAVVPSGVSVRAGHVLAGVDGDGNYHLLVPLRPGEAFAEDRSGGAVNLMRLEHEGLHYLSAVCLSRDLDDVFTQFAKELLHSLEGAETGARSVVESLARWRALFSTGQSARMSDSQVVGLLGELLTLERIVELDPARRISSWTGPFGSEHDFVAGGSAIEVKSTTAREGRLLSISSVDQLDPPSGGGLYLAWYRFEPHPDGEAVPDVVRRVSNLAVEASAFNTHLAAAGYSVDEAETLEARRFKVVEHHLYDTNATEFPRLTRGSFVEGDVPPGVLRVSYQIDLTNQPPVPLTETEMFSVLQSFARS